MWELVLDFRYDGEADSTDESTWDVDHSSDLNGDFEATFEVFILGALQFLAVAADEQTCHVVRVREFPATHACRVFHHILE